MTTESIHNASDFRTLGLALGGLALTSLVGCGGARTVMAGSTGAPPLYQPARVCLASDDAKQADVDVLWAHIVGEQTHARVGFCPEADQPFKDRWLAAATGEEVQTMIACLGSGVGRTACAAHIDRLRSEERQLQRPIPEYRDVPAGGDARVARSR